ncbi:MAG: glycosyltransferase, partial [bacterium]
MNLIVLSHMYPAQGNIYAGAFVVKQLTALTKIIEGEAFVVAPIPWAPSVLYFRDKWRNYAATKKYSLKNNIKIYRARYFRTPSRYYNFIEPFAMYISARTVIKHILSVYGNNFILHAHAILPDGLTAVFLKKEFNLPVVCTAHGSDTYDYPFRSKLLYHQAKTVLTNLDAIVPVSSKLKDIIYELSSRRHGVYVV